jgi:hypothetical protein
MNDPPSKKEKMNKVIIRWLYRMKRVFKFLIVVILVFNYLIFPIQKVFAASYLLPSSYKTHIAQGALTATNASGNSALNNFDRSIRDRAFTLSRTTLSFELPSTSDDFIYSSFVSQIYNDRFGIELTNVHYEIKSARIENDSSKKWQVDTDDTHVNIQTGDAGSKATLVVEYGISGSPDSIYTEYDGNDNILGEYSNISNVSDFETSFEATYDLEAGSSFQNVGLADEAARTFSVGESPDLKNFFIGVPEGFGAAYSTENNEDLSKLPVGTHTIDIRIQDTLWDVSDFQVFQVEVFVQSSAELNLESEVNLNLGQQFDPKSVFKSATDDNGQSLSVNDTDRVELVSSTTDEFLKDGIVNVMGDYEIKYLLKNRPNNLPAIEKSTLVHVGYGDAIVLRGLEHTDGTFRDAAGAFPLVDEGGSPKIVATSGAENSNDQIHNYFSGNYVSFGYYSLGSLPINLSDANNLSFGISGDGDTLKQDFLDQWGNDRVLDVNYGDVVKVKDQEGKNGYTQDSVYDSLDTCTNPKEIFYEITQNGYKPLSINQFQFSNLKVEHSSDPDEIKRQIQQEFDSKNNDSSVTIDSVTPPSTNTSGNYAATVVVLQNLSTGKAVTYSYQVPVTVNKGTLSFEFDKTPSNYKDPTKGIDFGSVVVDGQAREVHPSDALCLTLSDKRDQSERNGWYINLKKTKEFATSSGEEMNQNILWFKDLNDTEKEISNVTQTIFADTSGQSVNSDSVIFENGKGVFLKIPESLSINEGDYSCELEWTLTDAPL